MPKKKTTKVVYPVPRDLQLPLTSSQVDVLYNILDEVINNHQWDATLVAYTRSTANFTTSISNQEYEDIVDIRDNLI